ncbi:MAG: hypothetical protein H7A01_01325 [Hahellaceae bacterium]|jgi:hypothetical protein|nr:hypothetical protein [Hahellaceae bacterium]
MNTKLISRYTFILGATLDAGIAVSWLFIASGVAIPNILSGYQGSGADYRFAMYRSALFICFLGNEKSISGSRGIKVIATKKE